MNLYTLSLLLATLARFVSVNFEINFKNRLYNEHCRGILVTFLGRPSILVGKMEHQVGAFQQGSKSIMYKSLLRGQIKNAVRGRGQKLHQQIFTYTLNNTCELGNIVYHYCKKKKLENGSKNHQLMNSIKTLERNQNFNQNKDKGYFLEI